MSEEIANTARKAVRQAVILAHESLYTTKGASWRQIIASIAFETKADLSLLQYFDEEDRAHFTAITQAFMDKAITPGEIVDIYLEFFPRPLDIEGWTGDGPSF